MNYLVEMTTVESRFDQGNPIELIEGQVFPSFESLIGLESSGKIMGGVEVGSRKLTFIADCANNEELDELIKSLPVWMLVKTKVTPLADFGQRKKRDENFLKAMK